MKNPINKLQIKNSINDTWVTMYTTRNAEEIPALIRYVHNYQGIAYSIRLVNLGVMGLITGKTLTRNEKQRGA